MPLISHLRLHLFFYAQNHTGLQVQNLRNPVILNIFIKLRRPDLPSPGKAQPPKERADNCGEFPVCRRNTFTCAMPAAGRAGPMCGPPAPAGLFRPIPLKLVYFGFAGPQIGVCRRGGRSCRIAAASTRPSRSREGALSREVAGSSGLAWNFHLTRQFGSHGDSMSVRA
jgi:hypothetical protein